METRDANILIVDDEPRMARSLQILLAEEGYQVERANSYYEALDRFNEQTDLVITDLTMPGKTGLDLLREVKRLSPETVVLLMTAYSTVESAVEAMKQGALEYLVKPFRSEDLLSVVERALRNRAKKNRKQGQTLTRYGDLVGKSTSMQKVYRMIDRAAETDSTVLITGPSGTGKELVARAVHFNGTRKRHPFVCINCAALPETLLETELFGHERGAFSGAVKDKQGKFEVADRGTIFLDEIGEMSPSLQVKLLRVLQDKSFERVGSTKTIQVDVRIVAATNQDLSKAIIENRFREDLYYRLNVLGIQLPSLKQRRSDIPLLVEYFLRKKCRELSLPQKRLSDESLKLLTEYEYPGNVRELENIIERSVIIAGGNQIKPNELPIRGEVDEGITLSKVSIPVQDGWLKVRSVSKKLERALILQAIREDMHASNSEIAKKLGTSRRILELRLKEFEIDRREVTDSH